MAGMGDYRKSEEDCEPRLIRGDNVTLSDPPPRPKNMLAGSLLYNITDNAPLTYMLALLLGMRAATAMVGQPKLLKIATGTIVADGANTALKPIEKEYYKDPYSSYALATEQERDNIIKKRMDYPLTFVSTKVPLQLPLAIKQIINYEIGKYGPRVEDSIRESAKKDEEMGPRTWR